MFQGLSSLKAQLAAKLLEEAVESAKKGRHMDAAAMFDQSGVLPGEHLTHAGDLAYAFYRRALTHRSNLDGSQGIGPSKRLSSSPGCAAARRTAERGMDMVVRTGEHLGNRLGIPIRTDSLKRADHFERFGFVSKSVLAGQYSFNQRKAEEIRGRAVLLLDDVMTRGYTAGVCDSRLREFG